MSDNRLDEARHIIDEADREMAKLFERRMAAVRTIADYKRAHDLPILDEAREREVIARGLGRLSDESLRGEYVLFQKGVMEVSRLYQRRLSEELWISLPARPLGYAITLARGALRRAGELFSLGRRAMIVTDDGVPPAYAEAVASRCREAGIFRFPQGERSKNPDTLRLLLSRMLESGMTRSDCVIAVGGGVAGDLAGFAAACYMRGIDFYNVPTTLLAQVDSSVGGKTAVDFGGVKNVVGAFHQPKGVLIDPDLLETLPPRQIANGLAEAVKMAVCFDAEGFALFEEPDPLAHLDEIIRRALEIKKDVVERDEREAGLRRALNFGHTLGHGIESLQKPDGLLHGECVALGMLPMCGPETRRRLLPVLRRLGLPTRCACPADRVMRAVRHDKKAAGGRINAVLSERIGSFEIRSLTPEDLEGRCRAFFEEENA